MTESVSQKTKNKPSIRELMYSKAMNALGPVEHEIDQFIDSDYTSDFNMYNYLRQLGFKPKVVKIVQENYEELLSELNNKEKDFKEAYSFMNRGQKSKFKKFIGKLVKDCEKYYKYAQKKYKGQSSMRKLKRDLNKKYKNL